MRVVPTMSSPRSDQLGRGDPAPPAAAEGAASGPVFVHAAATGFPCSSTIDASSEAIPPDGRTTTSRKPSGIASQTVSSTSVRTSIVAVTSPNRRCRSDIGYRPGVIP